MRIIPCLILLVAVVPNLVHAGEVAIHETDSQIIVEYQGDPNEVIAAAIVKEKEEVLKAQQEKVEALEAERIQKFTENHAKQAEKRRAKYNAGYED